MHKKVNPYILIIALLDELGIRYTQGYLHGMISSLPYSYTLWGIQTALKHYGVKSEGLNVPEGEFQNLPVPFVAKTDVGLLVVTKHEDSNVCYISSIGESVCCEKGWFLEHWSGKVLLPKDKNVLGEYKETEHRRKAFDAKVKGLAKIMVGSIVVINFAYLLIKRVCDSGSWMLAASMALLIVGLILSSLLLQEQVFMGNVVTQKLCGSIKNGNCSGVIHSEASRLPGGYNWSEVGFAYFFACLCYLCRGENFGVLTALSFCALPYSCWSIGYQWLKLHQWCMLCVLVQVVLILDACLHFLMRDFCMSWADVGFWGFAFLITLIVIDCLAFIVQRSREGTQWEKAYKQLKYSNGVLETLCKSENADTADKSMLTSIAFGNREAEYQVTVFGNLHCVSCAQLHEALRRVDHDHCCIRYYFTTLTAKYEESAKEIIACYLQRGEKVAEKMLDAWYGQMAQGKQPSKMDSSLDLHREDVERELEIHRLWMRKNELVPTPVVYINGKKLPRFFTADDMIVILP